MDGPYVFAPQAAAPRNGLPAPLDGEIIPPRPRARPEKAAVPPAHPKPATRRTAADILLATTVAGLFGLGAAGGFYLWDRARTLDATTLALHQVQHELVALKSGVSTLQSGADLARQDDVVRTLRKSVETLKSELEATRSASGAATAQLAAKLDKADRDPTGKLAELSSRLDKVENPGAKLSDLTARLDRIERQVSSPAATGSIAAPTRPPQAAPVPQTAVAQTPDKALPRPATLGNWVVRDVYDGIALVEGRAGGIREVTPGEFLPGAGEVRSIQRRGRAWVVVTSRGIIDDSTW